MKTEAQWIDMTADGGPRMEDWYEIMYQGDASSVRRAWFDGDCWCSKEFGDPLVFGDPVLAGDCYRKAKADA